MTLKSKKTVLLSNKTIIIICVFLFGFMLTFSHTTFAISKSQKTIKMYIYDYLKDSDNEFAEKFKGRGYCQGISVLWLYLKGLQTQPNYEEIMEEDLRWFYTVPDSLVKWKGKDAWKKEQDEDTCINVKNDNFNNEHNSFYAYLVNFITNPIVTLFHEINYWLYQYEIGENKLFDYIRNLIINPDKQKEASIKEKIEMFITIIEFFQHTDDYLSTEKYTGGTLSNIHNILEDTNGRKLNKEYCIAASFSIDKLTELLETENVIQENALILIASTTHATALFKDSEYYYYFDPNNYYGEIKTTSAHVLLWR